SLRNDQTIRSVADDLNISLKTLKKWMKKTELNSTRALQPQSKRPDDWRPAERLTALHQTYGLNGEALNAWCREQGVFPHQLEQWKTDFCHQGVAPEKREEARVLQALKTDNQRLERELLRKDKALAEAAALLVLQKKFRALLGGEAE
ncbi:MAG: transposase, partial [Methylobacter sp.]